eukprot:CAMPEP_0194235900 /NCGR_PEP_ID=MMETSP0158-20130606/3269_1 /TAXON_ID=33649 /ORGANISM="Thalassionema nitzschioides, Strain L26-B" /LENGTH=1093 /DNA_ID=CAMNT_0038969497 /DNA_START=37 /DNA_END=3314 /DNA_ORIENTATION=+
MTTPVSRKRAVSENEQTPGIFSRLFSSVKKARTVQPSITSTGTTPLRPRRVHLTPPSMTSPAANNKTVTDNEVTGTTAHNPRTNGGSTAWESSSSLGGPAVLNLNTFDSQMRSRRRRTRYRPGTKTLLARKQRRQAACKDWKEESINVLLEQNKSLFSEPTEDSRSSFNTTTLRAVVNVSRKLGTNQHGSRFPPTKDLSQRVSFEEEKPTKKGISFNGMQTPVNTNRPVRVKRQQTPGFQQLRQPTTPSASIENTKSPASTATTSSTSAEPAVDELKVNLDGPFLFDGEDTEPSSEGHSIIPDDTFVSWDTQEPVISEEISFCSELPGRFRRKKQDAKAKDVTVDEGITESHSEDGHKEKRIRSTWGANMFAHSAGKWKCEHCYVMNDEVVSQCTACEQPRGEGVANGSKPPASEEVASGKFPFGVPPASSPATAKQSTFSFGSNPAPSSTQKATGAPFSFGVASSSTSATSNSAAGGFSFGVAASAETKEGENKNGTPSATKGFSFGMPLQNAAGESDRGTKEATPKATLQFGSTSKAAAVSSTTTEPQSLSKKESEKKQGEFTFGAPTGNLPVPKPEEGKKTEFNSFSFGAAASTSKPTEAKPIAFGVKSGGKEETQPLAKPAKNVRFGDTSFSSDSKGDESTRKKRRNDDNTEASTALTPEPATPLFGAASSGSTTKNNEPKTSISTPSFSFGSTAGTQSSSAFTQSTSTPSTGPSFTFGSTTPAPTGAAEDKKPVQTPGPSFAFGKSTPAATGAADQEKPVQTPGPSFTFGGSTPATTVAVDGNKNEKPTQAPSTGLFTFGSTTPATTAPLQPPISSAATTPAGLTTGPTNTFGAAPVAAPAPFGSTTTAPAATPSFGGKPTNAFGAAPAPVGAVPASGFGSTATQPFNSASTPAPSGASAFGSTPGPTSFGATTAPAGFSSTIGQTFGATPVTAPTAFGSNAPNAGFGAPAPSGSNTFAFSQTAPAQGTFGGAATTVQNPSTTTPAANGFGAPSFGGTPAAQAANSFGAPNMATPNTAGGFNIGTGGNKNKRRIIRAKRPPAGFAQPWAFCSKTLDGKTPKEMLLALYQQYNASKLHTVDQVLQKYQG